MSTKAKNQAGQTGFFERIGAQIDCGLAWIGEHIYRIRTTYSLINSDYIKVIRSHKLSKILPPSLIILTLLLIMIPIYLTQVLTNDTVWYDNSQEPGVTAPQTIVEGELSQKISNDGNLREISDISIVFGTHRRQNNAEYEFLIQEDGKTLQTQHFSSRYMKDNAYRVFKFSPIKLEEDAEYTFVIRALNASPSNAIAIYRNSSTNDIIYRMSGRSEFYYFVIIISGFFLLVFFGINYLINSKVIKNEFQYLAYMSFYIISLIFIYPVNTIPDEFYHFSGAVRLAQYDFSESLAYNNTAHHDIYLPENSEGCITSIHMPPQWDKITNCLEEKPNAVLIRLKSMKKNNGIISYIPAALGIKFGDFVSNSPMVIYYCGRIFNLIAIGVMLVFALSLVKKHRLLFISIIMIPMFLQQIASYSYDGILNALCVLLMAYSVRFLTTAAVVRKRDICIILVALILIGLIKIPYIVIATPLLFVKSEKIGKYKATKWALLIGILIATLAAYFLDQYVFTINTDQFPIDYHTRGLPLSTLLAHPRASIKLFLNTFWTQSGLYLTGLIGYFGWFFFSLNPIIICSYIIFLMSAILSNREKFSNLMRSVTVLAAATLAGCIFIAMYTGYTTEGAPIVEGVQGRYFLPVLLMIMFALIPKKQKLNLPNSTYYAFLNFTTLCYIITLLVGFY